MKLLYFEAWFLGNVKMCFYKPLSKNFKINYLHKQFFKSLHAFNFVLFCCCYYSSSCIFIMMFCFIPGQDWWQSTQHQRKQDQTIPDTLLMYFLNECWTFYQFLIETCYFIITECILPCFKLTGSSSERPVQ